MSESFDAAWLALREAADAEARAADLVERARHWLSRRREPLRIVDLGAGAGNNPAWLAPRLPGPQRWRLVDRDEDLLKRADARLRGLSDVDGREVVAEHDRRDLADAAASVPDGTDLATASALFDLVPARWVDALAARCAAVGCAALWTLTVDGHWRFVRSDGESLETATDAAMRDRLSAHQQRDKGLGEALGGDAPGALVGAFRAEGYAVRTSPSPWRLAPGRHQRLAATLLDGWGDALHEQAPDAGSEIDAWRAARREAIENGELGIEVGHVDIWAEPCSE
ncbi:MAG: class I SAM-dependent methyltransferase [Candidatus Wenzhouxiangella sp. M2_3B_020]